MEIGIIGLGAMGREIARNLAAAGHDVKAWSRSGGDVAGVRMVETPAQALQADVAAKGELQVLSAGPLAALETVRPVLEVIGKRVWDMGTEYQVYSANIIHDRYEPGFKASLGLKDLRLAHAAAEQLGRNLPMLDAVRHRMGAAVNAGGGERDWSVMADYTIRSA